MEHTIWVVDWDGEAIEDAFTTLEDATEFVLAKIKKNNPSDYDFCRTEIEKTYDNLGFYIDDWVYCYSIKLHD